VTIKVQVAFLPDASVVVPVTVVLPNENVDPLAGLTEVVKPPQLSVPVMANVG
jgi:hypothetical protein